MILSSMVDPTVNYSWLGNFPYSKPGKTPKTEKYVCNIININFQLESPLQVQDLDIAHPLPSKNGTPIIIKFLRKTQ